MYGGLNIAHMTFRLGKAGLIIMLVAHVKAHTQRHTETHTHLYMGLHEYINVLLFENVLQLCVLSFWVSWILHGSVA